MNKDSREKMLHPIEGFHDGIFLGYKTLNEPSATVVVYVLDADGQEFEVHICDVISLSARIEETKSSIYEIQIQESGDQSTFRFMSNMESQLEATFSGELLCYESKMRI